MVWAVSLSTMELSPHCLTPGVWNDGIPSLIGFGKRLAP
jgi:hypothetical protein